MFKQETLDRRLDHTRRIGTVPIVEDRALNFVDEHRALKSNPRTFHRVRLVLIMSESMGVFTVKGKVAAHLKKKQSTIRR
ncbi:hypothetical protein VNO80_10696 [Phaseolus coccineus]|uniref:Uncharacterized protein n=1 Tax=Phaseolus coccineus TaxID=3886 RepID=A0AAN9NDW0_PHACN